MVLSSLRFIPEGVGYIVHPTLSMLSLEGKTRMTFDYKLFKGVSVQLDNVNNADEKASKMSAAHGIKRMWPVEVHSLPDESVAWTGTPSKNNDALLKRKNSSSGKFSPHVMTQIDNLHSKGYKGKGVKIAVIDTGVSTSFGIERSAVVLTRLR